MEEHNTNPYTFGSLLLYHYLTFAFLHTWYICMQRRKSDISLIFSAQPDIYLLEINLAILFLLLGERAEKWGCAERRMEKFDKRQKNKTVFIWANWTHCHREAAPSCPWLSTAAIELVFSVKMAVWDCEMEHPNWVEAQRGVHMEGNWCTDDCTGINAGAYAPYRILTSINQ